MMIDQRSTDYEFSILGIRIPQAAGTGRYVDQVIKCIPRNWDRNRTRMMLSVFMIYPDTKRG